MTEYEKHFTISIYSHFFKLSNLSIRGKQLANMFAYRFAQRGMVRDNRGKYHFEIIKMFAASTKDRREYRFHINTLAEFKIFLDDNYITDELYTLINIPLHESLDITIKVKSDFILRDYQIPAVEFLSNKDINISLLEFSMGRGKGACSITALSNVGKRTLFVIKPTYIEKWVKELHELLLEPIKNMIAVRGGDQLKGLIEMAKDGTLNHKLILISNRTYQNFISSYEEDPSYFEQEYGINTPEDLYSLLKIGVKLVDEVHQEFHSHLKVDLYTNVYKCIYLSATLINNNEFLMKMYKLIFPNEYRYNESFINRYIEAYAVYYNIKDNINLRTVEYGSTTYSHHAFEKSIIKHNRLLNSYFKLIDDTAEDGYFKEYVPGDKLIIFAVSINLVTEITDYFKLKYPNLNVVRYVEDDPFKNVLTGDIIVTAIANAGTAFDIKGLVCVIMTTAINSIAANKQAFGRLREIKGRNVRFYALNCNNVDKHKQYATNRKEMLLPIAKTYKEIYYPLTLG